MSLVNSAPCSRSASRTSSVAPDVGSSGCASPRTDWSSHGRSERITSVTGVARDADELLRCGAAGSGSSRTFRPRPGNLARHAQLVEPGAAISGHAAREHRLLPDAGGDLEALELRDGGGDAGATLALRARCDSLPAKQESHEVLRRDRLDLLTQALLRVRVDADEQATRAPLVVARCPDRSARESQTPHPRASRARPRPPSRSKPGERRECRARSSVRSPRDVRAGSL